MERGLVVEGSEVHTQLIREAAEHADGADADLVLLAVVEEEELEHDVETLSSIGEVEGVSYGRESVLAAAADELEESAREILEEHGVEYEAITTVSDDDEEADTIIDVAEEHDCDHVFLVGRRRSPTGKAVFGDTAQQVVLNFNGYVTMATE